MFRAITASQFRRSEPSLSLLCFGVQSHHCRFLVLAFRVIIVAFQFRRSGLSSVFSLTFRVAFFSLTFRVAILGFGVQSHHHFLVSAFRAITVFSVWRSEPSPFPRLTFRVAFSVLVFRVVITSQVDVQSRILGFGVQSHHHFLVLAFRAITVFLVWRSESL